MDMIRRKCASPNTITWSMHSRRIEPINRSTYAFCWASVERWGGLGYPGHAGVASRPSHRRNHGLLGDIRVPDPREAPRQFVARSTPRSDAPSPHDESTSADRDLG